MVESERSVRAEVIVDAEPQEVWQAWTTEAGARSFFAPACRVEMRIGGAYEMYFNLDAPQGERGGEGLVILALQAPSMLSFTWNAPPELPTVRPQRTHVVVRIARHAALASRVTLCHDGWGQGGEWEQALVYFQSAWSEVVLPRLRYRFAVGPMDWSNRPDLASWR
jgi:uncharacterized protein YndB with AHSA1/START domain